MKITYYGHSCLEITINEKHILVDPFISGNAKAVDIDIKKLKADYIMLTHAHYDHVMDVESITDQNKQVHIISNHEIVTYYTGKGLNGHAMNPGGSWNFDFGVVKMVNATHSSSFPDGTYGGGAIGFIIQADNKTIYIAGDTALTSDMKLIPMFFKLDLAVLPVGGNFTMDVNEAVVASEFIECDTILGVHYDTVELITINHKESTEKFAQKGKNLILLDIGESMEV